MGLVLGQPAPAGDAAAWRPRPRREEPRTSRCPAWRPRRPRSATCAPGRINWRLFAWMAPPSVVGALAGGYLAGEISESVAAARDRGRAPLQRARPAPLGAAGAGRGRRPRSDARLDIRAAVLSGLVIGLLGRPRRADPGSAADAGAPEAGRRGALAGGGHQPDGGRAGGDRRPGRAPARRPRPTGTCSRSAPPPRCRARCSARGSRDGSPSASSCGPSAWPCSWRARPRRCRPCV